LSCLNETPNWINAFVRKLTSVFYPTYVCFIHIRSALNFAIVFKRYLCPLFDMLSTRRLRVSIGSCTVNIPKLL
jgi:hypothetical protein